MPSCFVPMTLADLLGAPVLDIHGYDVPGALFEVEAFCERAWAKGASAVKIIHGRGQGRLRQAVLAWACRQPGYRSEDSVFPGETGAVVYVGLKRTAK